MFGHLMTELLNYICKYHKNYYIKCNEPIEETFKMFKRSYLLLEAMSVRHQLEMTWSDIT